MSETTSTYNQGEARYEVAPIFIEFEGAVVAQLRPKKIWVFASLSEFVKEETGEIVGDGRIVIKRNGKWIWEIKP